MNAVLESAPDGILVTTGDCITRANQQSCATFGFALADTLNDSLAALAERIRMRDAESGEPIPADQLPLVRALGGTPVDREILFRHLESELDCVARVSAAPVVVDGRIVGAVGLYSDVTERRREEGAQRFLAESGAVLGSSLDYQSTLRSVARHAVPVLADWCVVDVLEDGAIRRLAVAHTDPAKVELAFALTRMYPPDPSGPTGIPAVIRSGEAEFIPDVNEAALGALAEDPDHLQMIRRLGLRSYIVVPLTARGRTLGAISIAVGSDRAPYDARDLALAQDLGSRAALAIDNARLYGEARQAVQARDEVLEVVSHDLRNSLNAIVLRSEILRGPSSPWAAAGGSAEHLAAIEQSTAQMPRLIDDLVDVAGIEAGRLSLAVDPTDLRSVVEESMSAFTRAAQAHGVQLHAEFPDQLPRAWADLTRVLQVLSNLLGNAVRHTPEQGSVTVRVEHEGAVARVSVADTGPGIPPEDRKRVFDRYWRASTERRAGAGPRHRARHRRGPGREDLGGKRVGRGTTMHFTVPVVEG